MAPFAARLLATALPLVLVATIAAGAAYALAGGRTAPGRGDAGRAAVRALLGTYVLALAWWTVGLANPNFNGVRRANLVPFREIARSLTDREPGYGLLNFWGNVVAFVPVGVLLVLAMRPGRRRAAFIAVIAGTALSAVLEVAQYVVGRSADIDDVILNFLGVALGVGLATLARRAWSRMGPQSRAETGAFP